jgi:cell division protein FtsI (penicillin-binding protein 3)
MTEKQHTAIRAYSIYILFLLGMMYVIFKTFMIQSEGVTTIFQTTSSNSTKKIPTRTVEKIPRKGDILDCNGTSLVTSVSFFDIYMDPTVVKDEIFNSQISDLAIKLSEITPNRTAREWENYIRTGRSRKNRYLTIKKKATNEERRTIKTFPIFKLGRNKGGLIDAEEIILRKRPYGDLLKRTLGYYQNIPGKPELRVGIEGSFYEYLDGEPGLEIEQKLSTGWKKTGKVLKTAVEGANIVTTFDKEIQEVAQNELYNQLVTQKANSGCVIVMDVKTGYVKALANYTKTNDGNYYELYNQAIGTKEVPGSTFKLASLMAGLEDGKFKITDTVQGASSYTFYRRTLNEAKRHNYGKMTIQQAFEKSSNVISQIIYKAYKNEPQEFIRHLDEFGLTEPLGIDLKGEPNPTIYRPGSKQWSGISLPWMAVGYEVLQTPLQTLAFYNAVANNGTMVRPQFVQEIKRGTEIVKTFPPYVLRQKICSISTLEILQNCLQGVMINGTGKKLTSSYFDIAGKTGTAQVLNNKSTKGGKIYLASFVGYFPVKDPMFSCIVSVEAEGDNVYGSVLAGTVFSTIANKIYATSLKHHKAINEKEKKKKELPIVKYGNRYDTKKALMYLKVPYKQTSQDEWITTKAEGGNVQISKLNVERKKVPNVYGMLAKDAVYLIENNGMSVRIKGKGKVVKQSVKAGEEVYPGGVVELILE